MLRAYSGTYTSGQSIFIHTEHPIYTQIRSNFTNKWSCRPCAPNF